MKGLDAWRAIGGLGLLVAAWGALIVVRNRRSTAPGTDAPAPAASAPATDADEAAVCAGMIARAVELHRAARDAIKSLPSDNLRTIIGTDLDRIQRALLEPRLTADVAEGRWAAAKAVVASALADLERTARLVAGVLSSAAPTASDVAAQPSSDPRTAAEAFELLGINPDVSRSVAKKIVDGLRLSWHPDHARGEDDRARREVRMKQINAAWDLIRGEATTREHAVG